MIFLVLMMISILAVLDLSAAFDTSDHTILRTRLQHSLGIRHLAVSWFRSYLTDRKQTVCVNGIYFDPSALMYAVPQGSLLEPILFVLYATPELGIIHHHSLHHKSFADEIQVHQLGHITELEQLISRMQHCISFHKTNYQCSPHPKSFTTILSLYLWPPKGGRGCLMSPPCLESQGCHLIPLCYLLSCSSASSCYPFCRIVFCLLAHSSKLFTENSSIFFVKR